MNKRQALTKTMTPEAFNRGYWYATEIKAFAKEIGITGVTKLRKDELEEADSAVSQNRRGRQAETSNFVTRWCQGL